MINEVPVRCRMELIRARASQLTSVIISTHCPDKSRRDATDVGFGRTTRDEIDRNLCARNRQTATYSIAVYLCSDRKR